MSCLKKIQSGRLLELIARGRGELSRAGIEEAQEECERVWMKLLDCPRSGIYLQEREEVDPEARGQFLRFVEKRIRRLPLAYLLKEADFWQETLYVDERCLIPRPETEILVEVIKKKVTVTKKGALSDACPQKGDCHLSFLDIGTGSGAIAIALLREFPKAFGTLLDISKDALEVARMNVVKYGLQDRAKTIQGDLFEPFLRAEKWDLIVSNPPYLSEADFRELQPEVGFEPREALDGGKDGLDFYGKIIKGAKDHLTPGGVIALEVGKGQAGRVSTWLHDAGYDNIQRFKDYLGIERVVMARKGGI